MRPLLKRSSFEILVRVVTEGRSGVEMLRERFERKKEKTLKKFWKKEKGYYLCRPVTKGTKAERKKRRGKEAGVGSSGRGKDE